MDQTFDWLSARNMKASAIALLSILTLFVAVKTVSEIKEFRTIGAGINPSRIITVQGKGEVLAVPDIAEFTFSVIEEGKTVKDAQTKATTKHNATLALLKKEGIADKDIKTIGYNIYPKYDYEQKVCTVYGCPPGKSVLNGYEVNSTVSVKVRDISKSGDMLSLVGSAGASSISGLTFTVDKQDEIVKDAREKAIMDAKADAEVLAKGLGVRLGKVVSFSESGPIMPYYGKYGFGMGGAVADSASAPSPEVAVGENSITANVTITYEIR